MPSWAKAVAVLLSVVIIGLLAALVVAATGESERVKEDPALAAAKRAREERRRAALITEREQLKEARARRNRQAANANGPQPASAGTNGTEGQSSPPSTADGGKLSNSFAQLESDVEGEIGVAYSLGPGEVQQLGRLEAGHAWSSFKVPIVVTLIGEQDGSLTSEQESLAASAITASDNSAAAVLFSAIESKTGGAASAAIEEVLSASGGTTKVATAPPPPGAVSSWGQTEWSLVASTQFYAALACDAYGPAAKALAVGDMENVIPEQQWGLGQASFPAGTDVAIKAGWGPDGSESGPYLVRQAGIIRSAAGGQLVVTIAAQDSSGSFEAGVSDLNRVADWVADNLPLNGSC